MGQKVHPTGIRLGIVKDWSSKWYADTKTFPEYIRMDHLVRELIKKKLKDASVSRIEIERQAKKANILVTLRHFVSEAVWQPVAYLHQVQTIHCYRITGFVCLRKYGWIRCCGIVEMPHLQHPIDGCRVKIEVAGIHTLGQLCCFRRGQGWLNLRG